ncbi:MAG: CAP domain-containing protein [Alphaproteobacteria bacterium]|nr:CAP domain-containing protein [Alphaproteobacteria bacterium]
MNYFSCVRKIFLISIIFFSVNAFLINANEQMSKGEAELIRLTNNERTKAHLSPLQFNQKLMDVARHSSQYMADRDESAHHRPEGKSAKDRVKESGYCDHNYTSEVILTFPKFQNDFAKVLKSWMDSAQHKVLILDEHSEDIGVGMATSKNNKTFFTEVFSRKTPYVEYRSQATSSKVVPSPKPVASLEESPDFEDLEPLPDIADTITDPGALLVHLSVELSVYLNKERKKAKLNEFKADFTLQQLAEKDATYMASQNVVIYIHGNKSPIDRVIESGYCQHRYSSELGAVISDKRTEPIGQKWVATQSKIVLDGNFQECGIGLAYAKDKRIYIAAIFSRKTPFYSH